MIEEINVRLSLIKMYLSDLEKYENGDNILRMNFDGKGKSPEETRQRIKEQIEICNKHDGNIRFDDLSESAQEVVLELENKNIMGLKVELF